jgi:hypothetical protein
MTWTLEALVYMDLKIAGEVKTLKPGERVALPEDKAHKLLGLARANVRLVDGKPLSSSVSKKEQWIEGWRTLADLTSGIEQSDPRLNSLINLLKQADSAFERDNWEEFQIAASRVKNIAKKGT